MADPNQGDYYLGIWYQPLESNKKEDPSINNQVLHIEMKSIGNERAVTEKALAKLIQEAHPDEKTLQSKNTTDVLVAYNAEIIPFSIYDMNVIRQYLSQY